MKTNFHYFWCFWLVVSRKSTITVDIRTFFAKKLLVEGKNINLDGFSKKKMKSEVIENLFSCKEGFL
jgi:hypothetical protein